MVQGQSVKSLFRERLVYSLYVFFVHIVREVWMSLRFFPSCCCDKNKLKYVVKANACWMLTLKTLSESVDALVVARSAMSLEVKA